jgi:hypothetical protein
MKEEFQGCELVCTATFVGYHNLSLQRYYHHDRKALQKRHFWTICNFQAELLVTQLFRIQALLPSTVTTDDPLSHTASMTDNIDAGEPVILFNLKR